MTMVNAWIPKRGRGRPKGSMGFSADEIKRAVDLVRNGKTFWESACVVGCSVASAASWCRVAGVESQYEPQRGVRAEWVDGVDWNLHDVEIAELVGVSRERVRQMRNKLGKPKIQGRKTARIVRELEERVTQRINRAAALLRAGCTKSEIQQSEGINNKFITQAIKEKGIEYHRKTICDDIDFMAIPLGATINDVMRITSMSRGCAIKIKVVVSPSVTYSAADWGNLDWTKTDKELALQIGRTTSSVTQYRRFAMAYQRQRGARNKSRNKQ